MPTAKKSPTWEAPFTQNGSLEHYPMRSFPLVEWRVPEPFDATLTIQDGLNVGRSAKYLMLISDDGRTFPMFVADFLAMALKHGVPAGGRIRGVWVVRKRGKNFGVGLERPGPPVTVVINDPQGALRVKPGTPVSWTGGY